MYEYGYVRVSTKEQNIARQIIALTEFGIPKERIYVDKISGKNFDDRPAWNELKDMLCWGDVLVVESIDRLGRNYAEILEQWRHLSNDLAVNIVVLDMPLLDTRTTNDLTRSATCSATGPA